MNILIFAIPVIIVLIVLILVVRRNRTPNPNRLHMADIGTIIDRSVRSYRTHLVPLLVISALLVPLGNISNHASGVHLLFAPYGIFLYSTWDFMMNMTMLIGFLGALGIGKTLLACIVVRSIQQSKDGAPIRLGEKPTEGRWNAIIGLTAIMIIPSLLMAYLGIIGSLFWLFFAAAPVVMFYEGLGPWSAFKRSYSLVKAHYSALLNTLVPLWLIGWLLAGGTLYSVLLLLDTFTMLSPTFLASLSMAIWLLGGVFVAPLITLGALQFYLLVRERERATAAEVTPDVLHEALNTGTRIA
jgi:hypothetical protein